MADFFSVPGDDTDLLSVVIERQADGLEFQFSGPSAGTYAAYDAANPTRSAANLTSITGPNDHVLSAVPTGFANPAVTPVATNLEIKVYSRAGASITAAELNASPVWVGWATWDGSALVSQASYRAGLSATSAYSADEKLTAGRLNLLDRLATMIEQIGTSGLWRFLQGAFPSAPPGYGGAVSAAFTLHLAGATATGGCGCKAKGACGCSSKAEATLYAGDTKNRVFFLLDPGKSVVALPDGASVEIWDEDAKRGDATVTVTDPARWTGTLAIPSSVWNDAETPLQPGGYWLRVLDGDDQLVTVHALTILDPGQAR